MLDKARSKISLAAKPSVQEVGRKKDVVKMRSALASPNFDKIESDKCAEDTQNNTPVLQYEAVEFNKFIAEQVQIQLKQLLPRAMTDTELKDPIPSCSKTRPHYSKFLPDDQISVRSQDDETSIIGSVCSDDNNKETHNIPYFEHDISHVSEDAPASTDPIQWNRFLRKMVNKLNINCSQDVEKDEAWPLYLSSPLNPGKPDQATNLKLPLEGNY
ncbi:unnamed protein product [Mytilus coruscus]|uniref:Uncharacterized protein n=1 Tax=Mytilus coruscus TaxID=42192 RepID=A0A6J8CSH5_MYTCO|nr:unnamed protein product [Mytilus coruscus]